MAIEMCEIISTISRRSSRGSVCTSASKVTRSKESSFFPEIWQLWKDAKANNNSLKNIQNRLSKLHLDDESTPNFTQNPHF